MNRITLIAIVFGILTGLLVDVTSRALGCTVTLGGDLVACAMASALFVQMFAARNQPNEQR